MASFVKWLQERCDYGKGYGDMLAQFEPGSLEFSKLMIEKADVAVAPGIGFGEFGDDYVRLAIVENEQRIRQAARGVRRFFDQADQILHNVLPIKRPA